MAPNNHPSRRRYATVPSWHPWAAHRPCNIIAMTSTYFEVNIDRLDSMTVARLPCIVIVCLLPNVIFLLVAPCLCCQEPCHAAAPLKLSHVVCGMRDAHHPGDIITTTSLPPPSSYARRRPHPDNLHYPPFPPSIWSPSASWPFVAFQARCTLTRVPVSPPMP